VLELIPLVALPSCVRWPDVNGRDVMRAEQSRERVLGDRLPAPTGAPFRPGTTLDPSQLAREPFRGDLPKRTEDVADRSERLLQELPLLSLFRACFGSVSDLGALIVIAQNGQSACAHGAAL
jgi:hypothetical protein